MERLNTLFEDTVRAQKIHGVAAIALDRSGKVLFKGAYGTTNLADGSATAVTADTQFAIWSCTKIVTCVAALQLVEQGKLGLDDPVEKYLPVIKEIQIVESWDADGKPVLREPKVQPTVLHLLTHTAGFAYDFLEESSLKWNTYKGTQPSTYNSGDMHKYTTPFAHEPGEKHTYGVNIDWIGLIVEKISGQKLQDYVKEHITDPLRMRHTGPQMYDESKYILTHHRGGDGSLTANKDLRHPKEQDIFGGGHYLYSTLDDYSIFLLTLLNEGRHPATNVQILKPETVREYLFRDIIPPNADKTWIGRIETTIPGASNSGELLPKIKKGWSAGLMVNLEDLPTGRRAGSGAWAGLGNLYYWVDPSAGKLGLIMSAILPFLDPEVLRLFEELERFVYDAEPANGDHKHFKLEK